MVMPSDCRQESFYLKIIILYVNYAYVITLFYVDVPFRNTVG